MRPHIKRATAAAVLMLAAAACGPQSPSVAPSSTALSTAAGSPAAEPSQAPATPTPAPPTTPSPAPSATPTPPPPAYSVSGHVKTASGKPLVGATVTLDAGDRDSTFGGWEATTDAEGHFLVQYPIGRPPAGTRFWLTVRSGSLALTVDGRGQWTLKDEPKVYVQIRDTATVLHDIVWPKTVTVSGRLVWANGKPAAQVWVFAHAVIRGNIQDQGGAVTNAKGIFSIDLVPGRFTLYATLSRSDPVFLTVTVKSTPIKGLVGHLPVNR